ncbi:MAG: DJ-1/PfpI family protein [Deltaproteobacteria bacterium]|nr:DJ-1/PfpI family protein [Deltaproteobacteria bacterium]
MKTVCVPLAPGFEEIEAVTIIDVLRRGGVRVVVAGTEPGPIRGSHAIALTPETTVDAVDAESLDMIALPGGMPGTLHLRENPGVRALVARLAARGCYTTAICAAPIVLAAEGLLVGRHATSHPSVREQITAAVYEEAAVVEDGTVVTSRGAGTAMAFALRLVRLLVDDATAERLRVAMVAPR